MSQDQKVTKSMRDLQLNQQKIDKNDVELMVNYANLSCEFELF